jgi:hypothetical protein
MQSALLWSTTATAALTWIVHTFVGGVFVARPLLADTGLPKAAKWLAYYCWHLVTLMIAGIAAAFAGAALGQVDIRLAGFLSIFCLACSGLSAGVALKGGIAPWRFPSTSLFAMVGVLGLAAVLQS